MGAAVGLREDFGADELRRLAAKVKDAAQARRLLALAAVRDGMNRTEAARIGGMDRQTLRDWAHRFNQYGPDGLIDIKPTGRPSKLSDELSQPGAQYSQDKFDDGKAADKNMKICVGLGGALVIGGAVVYMLGRKKGATSAEQTTLVPTVSPDGVGLVLSGTLP